MNKKTMLIGLGVLAVAGIGYYMWKKKNETTSGASGCGCGCEEEESSNATAYTDKELDCIYSKLNGGSSMDEAKKACVKAIKVIKRNTSLLSADGSKVGGKKTANPSKATLQAWLATPKGQAAASRMPVNLNSGSGDSGMRYWGQGAWEWIKEQWYADRG
jgi:hypothetical protein